MTNFDAVLTQHAEEGFTRQEIIDLLKHLNLSPNEEVEPVCLEANNCTIFGFIKSNAADEKLDFDTRPDSVFGRQVRDVADNKLLETEDNIYDFNGIHTLMYY